MFEVKPVVREIKIFKESIVKAIANADVIEDNPEQEGKWETVEEPEIPMDHRITEWAAEAQAVIVDVFVNTYYESSTPMEYTVNTTYIVAYMPFDSYMRFHRVMALVSRRGPGVPSSVSQAEPTERPVPSLTQPPIVKGANPWQTLPTTEQIRQEATQALKQQSQGLRTKPKLPSAIRHT